MADAPGALEATQNMGPNQVSTLNDHLRGSCHGVHPEATPRKRSTLDGASLLDEMTTTSTYATPTPSKLEFYGADLGRQLEEELRKLEPNPYTDAVGITRGAGGSMHNYEGINSKLVRLTLGLIFSSFSAVSALLPPHTSANP